MTLTCASASQIHQRKKRGSCLLSENNADTSLSAKQRPSQYTPSSSNTFDIQNAAQHTCSCGTYLGFFRNISTTSLSERSRARLAAAKTIHNCQCETRKTTKLGMDMNICMGGYKECRWVGGLFVAQHTSSTQSINHYSPFASGSASSLNEVLKLWLLPSLLWALAISGFLRSGEAACRAIESRSSVLFARASSSGCSFREASLDTTCFFLGGRMTVFLVLGPAIDGDDASFALVSSPIASPSLRVMVVLHVCACVCVRACVRACVCQDRRGARSG